MGCGASSAKACTKEAPSKADACEEGSSRSSKRRAGPSDAADVDAGATARPSGTSAAGSRRGCGGRRGSGCSQRRTISLSTSTVFGAALWPDAEGLPEPARRGWAEVLCDEGVPEATVFLRGRWRGRDLGLAVEGSYTRDQEGNWIARVTLPREAVPGLHGQRGCGGEKAPVQGKAKAKAHARARPAAAPTTVVFTDVPTASTEAGRADVRLTYNNGGELCDAEGVATLERLSGGGGSGDADGVARLLLRDVKCGDTFAGDVLLVVPRANGHQRMRCQCRLSVGTHEMPDELAVGYAAMGGSWYLSGLALDGVVTPAGTLIVRSLTLASVEPGTYRASVEIDSWPRAVDVSLQSQGEDGRFVNTTFHWAIMTYTVAAVEGAPDRRDIDVALDVRKTSSRDKGLLVRLRMRCELHGDDGP